MSKARLGVIVVGFGILGLGLSACDNRTSPNDLGIADGVEGHVQDTSRTTDSGNHLTLALKVVSYGSTLSEDATRTVLDGVNTLWAQCDISFTLDQYSSIDPSDYGLAATPSTMGELSTIRGQFVESNSMLLVYTPNWYGSVAVGANAWSTMPGTDPSGAVFEAMVATNERIAAHEIGHLLNLDHVSDQTDLMSHFVGPDTQRLDQDQCDEARRAAVQFRSNALR
jgi:hypothetical protein